MNLNKLTAYEPPPARYTPEYAANREEDDPFVVLHRPLIRAVQLELLDLHQQMSERRPEEDATAADHAAWARECDRMVGDYHLRVLKSHVVGVESLFEEGSAVTAERFIEIASGLPELVNELIAAFRSSATLSEEDAGN